MSRLPNTGLIRVRRPLIERKLAFQVESLKWKRSTNIFQLAMDFMLEPLGRPRSLAFQSVVMITSSAKKRMKRKVDRGSPCLRPRLIENSDVGLPLTRIDPPLQTMQHSLEILPQMIRPYYQLESDGESGADSVYDVTSVAQLVESD
ncbi:hypothetical protein Tco_1088636 [Tanacetum coccineum]